MRNWTVEICIVSDSGEEVAATAFEKVTYKLHESFGKKANQVIRHPPFKIAEEGWGEFEMLVTLTPVGNPKGGDVQIVHDLNFAQERYEHVHAVAFRNPKPELLERLKESGSVGDGANGVAGNKKGGKKGARAVRLAFYIHGRKTLACRRVLRLIRAQVDMEKLASGLERLGDDDLLHVVQLVHDNKSEDTYTKNDIESKCRPSLFYIPPSATHLSPSSCMAMTLIPLRRRIPRRPLHSSRLSHQSTLGLYHHQSRR